MKVNNNFIINISKILMVLITAYAIIVQPLIDSSMNEKVSVYGLVDLEEPNSNEGNNEEEILQYKKIENQFIDSNLSDLVEINKKIIHYKECIISDSILEIHIPPPDFL